MNAKPITPLSKVLQLIAHKPLRYKSVSDIVIELQVSEKELRRACKTIFGKTPRRYLQEIKMAYANELLLNNVPLKKICKATGYSSKNTFTAAFSKHFLATPTKIKKLLKVKYDTGDIDELLHFLEGLHPVSPGLRDYLLRVLKHQFYPRGNLLLKEAYCGNRVWFVVNGLVRWYYTDENDSKQKTTWFSREGEVILDPNSFYLQLPATVTIEPLEDCET
ncbi:MAG: helix-turn-helix domain-containing protein, partial [Terrimonas sp.]|nr:helix-turn-helix domain-containing protein [Terrimonas sp.]